MKGKFKLFVQILLVIQTSFRRTSMNTMNFITGNQKIGSNSFSFRFYAFYLFIDWHLLYIHFLFRIFTLRNNFWGEMSFFWVLFQNSLSNIQNYKNIFNRIWKDLFNSYPFVGMCEFFFDQHLSSFWRHFNIFFYTFFIFSFL